MDLPKDVPPLVQEERAYTSPIWYTSQAAREDRHEHPQVHMGCEQAAAAVMGVWSVANTREAIWDAMKRRETYATTGPRIQVRFYGGFDFADTDLQGDLVATGYAKGVPMGGELRRAAGGQAASFLVAVTKDPDADREILAVASKTHASSARQRPRRARVA